MKYNQRDVVEISFDLPDGSYKIHPCIIVSTNELQEAEDFFYVVMLSTKRHNPEYIFEITPEMLTYQTDKISYAKCHLIARYTQEGILRKFGSIKKEAFEQLLKHINLSIFGLEL